MKDDKKPKTKLRELRQQAGLSILRLSKLAGVNYTSAWYADGGHKGVSLDVKQKLAAVFGLTLADVFPESVRIIHAKLQMFVGPSEPREK